MLPVAAAFVVTMMLGPLSERADACPGSAGHTAIVLWLLVLAAFYMVITLVSAPVVGWIDKAPDIGRSIQEKFQLFERPLAALRDLRNALLPADASKGINVDLVAIAQQAVSVVTPATGKSLIFFVALFFMLLGRHRLRHVLVGFFHRHEARLRTLKILNDIERNLTGYLSVVAVINAGVGVGAGIIAAAVGLPDPVAWGVLGFVLNFIPYIGAGIMELGMFLVGLGGFPSLATRSSRRRFISAWGCSKASSSRRRCRAPLHAQSADGVSVAGVLGLAVGAGRRLPGGAALDRGAGRRGAHVSKQDPDLPD